jgi:GTPase Era involved in 16S rRNA processing
MTQITLRLDIPTLQVEVIELLEKTSKQMDIAHNGRWFHNGAEPKYQEFQVQLEEQIRSVKNLELRMAIVAPMKAGKSTIINVTAGEEIVPSHNDAMTTLPTEIVFRADLTEPILILSPHTCAAFQQAIQALQQKIQTIGIDEALKIANYPHLRELLAEIEQGFSLAAETHGRNSCVDTLKVLNHLIRLNNKLLPEQDIIESVNDFPRIETKFWLASHSDNLQQQGKLVVVDTPGPNEAGQEKLKHIVADQLRQCSLVAIVLDYTQLQGVAAAEVKEEVARVIELRGKKNLYVLINKIDQRGMGSNYMTTDQVLQFVNTNFGISNPEQIFEISALNALLATQFLRELEKNPETPIAQLETAPALAKATLGLDWQEELTQISAEKLKAKAEKLWQLSGFSAFLEKSIRTLRSEGTHRCMRNALELSSNCLSKLYADIDGEIKK